MSVKTVIKARRRNPTLSETELQEKYKDSKNKTIQAMLAARREHLQKTGKFMTDTEINRELKR